MFFFFQGHLHFFVTASLLICAMKPSPACLGWHVMGGGTAQAWLFPALPFHYLQDWGSYWTQSWPSIKDCATRQVFIIYFQKRGIFVFLWSFFSSKFQTYLYVCCCHLLVKDGVTFFLYFTSFPLSFPSSLISCCQNL